MNRAKFQYFRSRKHLQNVASLACQHCGLIGSTQASHSNAAHHGKGRSIRASDEFTAALCAPDHYAVDQGRSMSRSARVELWTKAHIATVRELVRLNLWPVGVAVPEIENIAASSTV